MRFATGLKPDTKISVSSNHNRSSESNGYLLFRFAGKPVIAVPNSSQKTKLAGLKRYRGFTIRRASFAWMSRFATKFRVERLLSEPVDSSMSSLLPFDFQDWLDSIRQSMNISSAEAVIVWPPQLDRGRIYVHLLDAAARPIAFVKLSLDALNDECLRREAQTLENLKATKSKSFRVPGLMEFGDWNGHNYCVFEPISADAKPVKSSWSSFPKNSVKQISGDVRSIEFEELKTLSWWKEFWKATPPDSAFAREVQTCGGHSVRVCRVHGDLTPANMMRVDNQILIFDWEQSCEDGPWKTDEILFFLGLNQREFLANPRAALQKLNQRYLVGASPQQRCDVIMALAFIHSSNKQVATKILYNWESLNNLH